MAYIFVILIICHESDIESDVLCAAVFSAVVLCLGGFEAIMLLFRI